MQMEKGNFGSFCRFRSDRYRRRFDKSVFVAEILIIDCVPHFLQVLGAPDPLANLLLNQI